MPDASSQLVQKLVTRLKDRIAIAKRWIALRFVYALVCHPVGLGNSPEGDLLAGDERPQRRGHGELPRTRRQIERARVVAGLARPGGLIEQIVARARSVVSDCAIAVGAETVIATIASAVRSQRRIMEFPRVASTRARQERIAASMPRATGSPRWTAVKRRVRTWSIDVDSP